MGIPHKSLELSRCAAMKVMMMSTVLMVAYLAIQIYSKTYLIETANKDHGHGSHRKDHGHGSHRMMPPGIPGSDYGADYQGKVCKVWDVSEPWSTHCRVYRPRRNPPECLARRDRKCTRRPLHEIAPSFGGSFVQCPGGDYSCEDQEVGILEDMFQSVPCSFCDQFWGRQVE